MIYDLQKGDLWKRISAGLFDFIMIGILIVAFAFCVSWITGYDNYVEGLNQCYERYEKEYNIDLEIIGTEKYEKLSDEDKARYEEADKAFQQDKDAIYYNNMILNLTLVILIISVILAYTCTEFVVPLLFKNGQTLGKKIFGLAVMRYDGVRVSPLIMFVRTILGKCTVETLVPAMVIVMFLVGSGGIFSIGFIAIFLIAQLGFILFTKERTLIHDMLGQTVVVDFASQMIFDSPEALLEYKQRIAAERAERSDY